MTQAGLFDSTVSQPLETGGSASSPSSLQGRAASSQFCDVYRCQREATFDITRHIRICGLTGRSRYLCELHGQYLGPHHRDRFRICKRVMVDNTRINPLTLTSEQPMTGQQGPVTQSRVEAGYIPGHSPLEARLTKKAEIYRLFINSLSQRLSSAYLHARFGSAVRTRISEINNDPDLFITISNQVDFKDGQEQSVYWATLRERVKP